MKLIKSTLLNAVLAITVFSAFLISCKQETEKKANFFDEADKIIESINIKQFNNLTLNIKDLGAVADAKTLNTKIIIAAIDSCNAAGGGKVIIPYGDFLTGPIVLKSNVTLHLEEGANVLFSTNPDEYLPLVHTSYEGVELMNYSPLIRAYKQKNIAVTGKGTLNGQADNNNWWPWVGKERYGWKEGTPNQRDSINLPSLRKMNEDNTPISERVFGDGYQFRPTFFEPFECENVLLEGVTIKNAPFWVIHPLKCNYVRVDGVTVESHGPNNDGCDPEYSKNVHITNCKFDTGDDCIAIKSGRNNDGRRVKIPSENIVVENCEMKDGHGGVVMGSEISAGVRNVYVRNCNMDSPNLDRAIRIKTNTLRGGFVENVYVKNIKVGQVKEALLRINTFYGTYANQEGEFVPTIKNIYLEDITVENSGKYGVLIKGRKQSPVENVSLTNVHIKNAKTPMSVENSQPVIFNNSSINGKNY